MLFEKIKTNVCVSSVDEEQVFFLFTPFYFDNYPVSSSQIWRWFEGKSSVMGCWNLYATNLNSINPWNAIYLCVKKNSGKFFRNRNVVVFYNDRFHANRENIAKCIRSNTFSMTLLFERKLFKSYAMAGVRCICVHHAILSAPDTFAYAILSVHDCTCMCAR